MDKNQSYLGSMYIEIDRNAYESQGSIELVGEPMEGNALYETMLEEEHGMNKYAALGSGGLGYDIVSPNELDRLLRLVSRRSGSIAGYFLKNRNSGNTIKATIKMISKDTDVSMPTVHKTISDLRKAGFLKKGMNAEYMVSPNLIYRGKFSRSAYLRKVYEHFGKENMNNKEEEDGIH